MISTDQARENRAFLRCCLREDHAGVHLAGYMDVLAYQVG